MILFERVTESFRQIEGREWALLFLETLGVVLGILIAFELNEWASGRSAAATHRRLMERLFEESQSDVGVLRRFRTMERGMADNEKSFAIQLSGGECPAGPAWRAVTTINMYPPITVPSGVYEELMGAGGLSTIEDRGSRAAIEAFRGNLDFAARQSESFHSGRTPAVDIGDPRVTVRFDPTAADPEIFSYDRTALCTDPRFRNRMIDSVRDHRVILSRELKLTDLAIAMCANLGRLVGRTCVPPGGALDADDQATARKSLAGPER